MKAILLCAGRGTRLRPITNKIPKCLVKVNGIPIIEYTRNILRHKLGITELIIITGYKGDLVKQHFLKPRYTFENLIFVKQDKPNGTANALYLAKKFIGNEDFLVLSGDTIYDWHDLVKLKNTKNSILYVEKKGNLERYGVLNIDSNNTILSIDEKKTKHSSNKVNCNAYHFDERVFYYIPRTPINKRFKERIITETINIMINDGMLFTGIKCKSLNEITYVDDIKRVEEKINGEKENYYNWS